VGSSKAEVTFVDSSPRDGLNTFDNISTSNKIIFINSLVKAGVKKIECVAFSHPRLRPEHSDAEQVMVEIKKKPGVTYVGLVPNEIGCRRAIITGVDEVLTLVGASDTYNRVVLGRNSKQTLHKTLPAIFETATNSGKTIRSLILTAFGCPYTGRVSFEDVVQIVLKLSFMGAKEVSLVDTTGMANPKSVRELVRIILDLKLSTNLAVHFHNTKGTAMANCIAAYESGVRIFDTSLGGLTGTPFGAPNQDIGYWHLPTEDLVHVFEEMGIKTTIDLERLLDAVKIAERIVGRSLPGHILRAKPNSILFKAPDNQMNLAS
jgi:hydroxymethylglutaryl-CoA lyase